MDEGRPLRCEGKQHAILFQEDDEPAQGTVEIKCDSRVCKKMPGIVVLHRWDLATGELETKWYRDPGTAASNGKKVNAQ